MKETQEQGKRSESKAVEVQKKGSVKNRGNSGNSWKLTKQGRERLLELVLEGYSYSKVVAILKEELKITITAGAIKYQVARNRDYILSQRKQAYDRALLRYPISTFEGRMAKAQETMDRLSALPDDSIAKYRAMMEVLKSASQDEIALRTLMLKEKPQAVNNSDDIFSPWKDLNELVKEFVEEKEECDRLSKLAGWE